MKLLSLLASIRSSFFLGSYLALVPLRRNYIPTTNHRSTQAKEIKNWRTACCSAVEILFTLMGIDYWKPLRVAPRNLHLLPGCAPDSPRRFSGFLDGCRRQEFFVHHQFSHSYSTYDPFIFILPSSLMLVRSLLSP